MKKIIYFFVFFLFAYISKAQDTTYIASGSSWKYLDNGSNQGTGWRTWTFNDTSWASGNAEFGYGDGGETTLINACGTVVQNPSCSNKYITTYFRRRIFISDTSLFRDFLMRIIRDDGVVVYVNDSEVVRSNMPTGTILHTTQASSAIGGADESTWNAYNINTRYFKRGWNIISVEIHQESGTSSDVSFNFELKGIRKPAVALQFNGSTSRVTFGTAMPLCAANFTLECWFRRTGTGATTSTGTGGVTTAIPLITKGRGESDGSNVDVNYFFGIDNATSKLCADFEEGTGQVSPGLNHPVTGITTINNNQWYHGAVSYDGQKWRLYLNGSLERTDSVGRLPQFLSIQHAGLGTAMTSTGSTQGFFAGAMDEVRIWNYARTPQQIINNMNTEITDTLGLLGYYRLNDSTGTIAYNSGSTNVNGTLVNTPTWVGGAPFNSVFTPINLPPVINSSAPDTLAIYNNATTLTVNASDPENKNVTVTFYGRQRPSQDSAVFSIIPLPDTQYYTGEANGGTNAILKSQLNWIVANKASRNIRYLIQLGDCVERGDNGGNDVEWKRADTSFNILENPITTQLTHGLPYGICVGNHDQGTTGDGSGRFGTSTFYNQYFGKGRFNGRSYYGGSSDSLKNNNHFQLFSASGMNFISISFEYDTNMDTLVLRWADSLLKAHPTRRGIVSSHWIITAAAAWSAQGQAIYDRLKNNPNLDLMYCGHVAPNGEARRTDIFNGNAVHTMLSDFQDRTQGGTGWLRINEFRPSEDKIYVTTYSPWLNQWETDANSQFTLDYDMGGNYNLLGSVTLASGSNANFNWTSLANNGKYDWYAVVNDSGNVNTVSTKVNKFSVNPLPLITSPNDGEIWKAGSQRAVTFDSKFIKNMKLDYSIDGSTWTNISTNINGNSYNWTLPNIRSNSVRLRLTDTTASGVRFDTTNTVFTILTDSFIVAGDFWNYKDNGSNQGNIWKDMNFVDTAFTQNGKAEFGYGDGGETTLVNACGTVVQSPSCSNKYITTYFRKKIFIEDISKYSQFKMGVVRDDGVLVYINGSEVYRSNLPIGAITYLTQAPSAIGGSDESAWQLATLSKTNFVTGWNTVAVEIHQESGTSSDLSFNFRLWGDTIPLPATAVIFPNGGEKLNMGANINVLWNANVAKIKLEYSTNGGSNWNLIADRVDGAIGVYNWQVPNIVTTNGLIRITDTANVSTTDISNAPFSIGTDTLINLGYVWKYRDLGTNPGATWKDSLYNDSTWLSGPSELGYGDGGEATVVSFGPSSTNKYRTTYFRRKIFIPNAARYNFYRMSVVRDDGAVVYVNGSEVWRDRMPTGIITDTTYANVTTDGTSETALNNFNITQATSFVTGWNTIAVSIHQVNATSSDISFNLRLIGDTTTIAPIVVNAPNGGELIYAGANTNITWTNSTLSGKVKIEYTTNGGANWNLINNNTLASAQTYAWLVPNTPSTQCLIKISDSTNASLFDTSNAYFSIIGQPAAFNPCVNPKHIGCFTSVQPMAQTQLLRINGATHTFQRIIKTGDALTFGGTMGANNDFTAFNPLNGSSKQGAVAINHESDPGGATVAYVRFDDSTGLWKRDSAGAVNFSAAGLVKTARNCSGGITPWGTTITSEETYTTGDANSDGYDDIGWHVEFSPWTRQVMDYNNDGLKDKLWKMGRMSHENVVIKSDSMTAYFAEDGGSQGLYKYVAAQKGRLDSGLLYVMQRTSGTGTWINVPNSTKAQCNTVSSVIAGLGGTNFNGPEDVEINPVNGMIYFTSKGNGIIYRFTDNGSTVSNFENYVTNQNYTINYGTGTANESWGTGIDNLAFDDLGNLWANQDGGRGHWWVVRPDHTPSNPKIELFATTPAGSESTGLTFTPDFKFGFISFQHPSANTQIQVDAAGDSIQFNTHTTIVFGNKNNFGPKWNYVYDDGNIAALRVGDGLSALSNRSAPLSIDQFNGTGTLINSINVPRTGTNAVCLSGSASSEGALTLASNNGSITFAGYKTDTGRVSVASTPSSLVPRAVVRVTPTGLVSIVTQTDTGFSTNNIRSSFTNGNGFWAVGGNSGVRYGTLSNKLDTTVSLSSTNNRVINSFGGQLYLSTGSGTRGIYRVGNGLPTNSGNTTTLYIPTGPSSSPYSFAFNNDSNICYIADDNNSSAGGIQKWRRVSGVWTLQYTLGTGVTNIGTRGLAVNWNTIPATIYATTAEATSNRIIKIVDSSATALSVTIATAALNTIYRGLAFVPGNSPLPVEFAGFNLKKEGKNQVNVSWSTASEINNNYFTVERSLNGADFESVAKVKGAGNSATVNNYNIIDLLSNIKQPATIYYRIKQTDFDGSSAYSVIKSISFDEDNSLRISEVFPNPFSDEVNVKINSNTSKEVNIQIVDINGKLVIKNKTILQAGENNLQLQLEQLKAGTYILSVSDGNSVQTFKLVK